MSLLFFSSHPSSYFRVTVSFAQQSWDSGGALRSTGSASALFPAAPLLLPGKTFSPIARFSLSSVFHCLSPNVDLKVRLLLGSEKSQRLKQKNSLNCRRGDRRNAKVPLSAKHDGLAGFRSAVGGTKMFAEIVIHRIFYYINRAGNGYLTLRELKRGNLIAAMQHAEEEEDINKVLRLLIFEQLFNTLTFYPRRMRNPLIRRNILRSVARSSARSSYSINKHVLRELKVTKLNTSTVLVSTSVIGPA